MKASRVKPVNSDNKKRSFFNSGNRRWFAIVLWDSVKELLRDMFTFILIVALAGGGFYLYQRSRPAAVVEKPPAVEGKSSELIRALEKYRAAKGVYPKTLRDAYDVPNKPEGSLMYQGTGRELVLTEACAAAPFSDPCWTGYKKYTLLAENEGKAYIYSSESRTWKEGY